jgi:hypothetical protein
VALNKQDLDRLKEGQESLLRNGFPASRPDRPRASTSPREPVDPWLEVASFFLVCKDLMDRGLI